VSAYENIVRFIHDTTWDDLPLPVQHQVKLCLLDTLGATLSGTLTPSSKIAAEHVAAAWSGNDATVLLRGMKSSVAGAAFANGCAANGLDNDDGGKYTKGHPGAQIFPTALAVAEKLKKSGQEMLTAMVVGYEVAHRTGRCWHDHHATYQACGSWGAVANAATAAHLMGLALQKIQHALGIAEYHAPNVPMMRDIDHPAMVKHGIGWGAFTGITAAQLAARGFTGIPSLLSFKKYDEWVRDIGAHYIMTEPNGILLKEFSCCRWVYAALYAARELMHRQEFAVQDIAHIRVTGFRETVALGTDLPHTTEEAQFNTAWPLAAMFVDGQVGPAQILEERFQDDRLVALVQKIELVESEKFNRLARLQRLGDPKGKYAATLELTLRDGRRLTQHAIVPDSGEHFKTRAWVAQKFRALVGHVLPNHRIDSIVELVWHFDDAARATELVQLVEQRDF
jgi:2-methylcitrate dehydratase PrpD